ncbi:MAG: hypothetical protein J6K17_05135 [Oscillospiraceae bacterium]|nr:hypothetical protein [Oscillospiraceae bacterium]
MVKITDEYYYEADGTQYTLVRKVRRPRGKFGSKETTSEIVEISETLGYYTTLETMLKSCAKHITTQKIANGEITTISEHIAELKRLKNSFEQSLMDF